MAIEALKQIWPEWQSEGRPLGKGSFGVVYKAVRRDHGVESYAAIKVISIPTDPSEVDSLRSEGLDMNATRTYLQGIVNDFVSEIQLMESLKGVQNIVSVEDYKVVEKTGEIGWDIYIRMELLTSFNAYICDKKLTEKEVIKLGCDICTALEICAKRNIIHRDIKPENIFVNDFGDFKLGDFGIARKLENMTGGLSQKGTFNYMAPEVANSSEYDARVDTYSLGIVLYRLLNGNRLPFLDTEKQLLNPNERRNAVDRRLRGEELPAPCDASPAIADLILRACAYDPNMRFASATEMKQALLSVANGTYQIGNTNLDRTTSVRKAAENYDKTTSVRKAPVASNQKSEPTVNTFGSMPKKKSIMPAVIATVLAIVLIVGVGIFAVPKLLDGNDNTDSSETTNETTSETSDYSEFDEEQIASIISEADALAAEEDYEGALTKVQTGLVTYPKSEGLQKKSEEYTSALNAQVKTNAITTAETLAQTGDYLGAFNTVDQAISSVGEDEELSSRAKEYEDAYVSNVVTQVDTYLEMSDFDAADQLVSEALKHFPNNITLKEKKEAIDIIKPQALLTVCLPYETRGYSEDSTIIIAGESHMNGFALSGGWSGAYGSNQSGGYAIFNLGGKYDTLELDIGHVDGSSMDDVTVEIILDGVTSQVLEIKAEDMLEHYVVPLNGASQMKISQSYTSAEYGFVNAILYPNGKAEEVNGVTNSSSTFLLTVCPPYETRGYSEDSTIIIAGESHMNGFALSGGWSGAYGSNQSGGYAIFNLGGKYDTLELDIGHVDGSSMDDVTVEIILDGVTSQVLEIKAEDMLEHYVVPLNGASQMKISQSYTSAEYGFVNAVVY